LSPDGKTAAAGGTDGAVRLWDVETGRQVGHPFVHPAPVTAVAFHPREPLLLSPRTGGKMVDQVSRYEHPKVDRGPLTLALAVVAVRVDHVVEALA
jgi:hypothetical protein